MLAAFKYHMLHDPCHEVRRAVIQKIAPTKSTLVAVLTRVNDVKDSVRREAYSFIGRLLIRQFTIKQRQLILESGLNDRSRELWFCSWGIWEALTRTPWWIWLVFFIFHHLVAPILLISNVCSITLLTLFIQIYDYKTKTLVLDFFSYQQGLNLHRQ